MVSVRITFSGFLISGYVHVYILVSVVTEQDLMLEKWGI